MSTAAIQHNLPVEPNVFIGRERDLSELRQLLNVTRLLTLCGAGGIGKSRLALRVAAGLSTACADDVLLVELADVTLEPRGSRPGPPDSDPAPTDLPTDLSPAPPADPVTRRLASVLRIPEDSGQSLTETVAEALRPRRTLLIIDNCEHLVDAAARLCQSLLASCPRLRIMTTSREPLRAGGETVWRVPPLETSVSGLAYGQQPCEAVALFVERAAAVRPGFGLTDRNIAAVTRVCRALDGVPLAIELAATRVRALSPEEIADRLADRFRVLGAGERTAPPRHRTLRATIAWSHDLLTEPERVLFRRLSVFASWTLTMAESVCVTAPAEADADPLHREDVLDLLSMLVDRSLVMVDREVAGVTFYGMLDSIRHYAAEQLTAAGEQLRLRRSHRDHMVVTCEWAWKRAIAVRTGGPKPNTQELITWSDATLDNVRAALSWSLDQQDAEAGLRLCRAMTYYWFPRGLFVEGAEWHDRFLTLDCSAVSRRVLALGLISRAGLAAEMRETALAESYAAEGLAACREAADRGAMAEPLNVLALGDLQAGRYEQAVTRLDEAVEITRESGDIWNEALSIGTLAAVRVRQGQLHTAKRLAQAAFDLMRGIDQRWGMARTLTGLGVIAQLQGNLAEARNFNRDALEILRTLDTRPETARCLAGLGRISLDLGALAEARRYLRESLILSQETGRRIGVARALEGFARLHAAEKRVREAVLLTAASAALRDTTGQAMPGARYELLLAPARTRLGDAVVSQLWAAGGEIPTADAITLALSAPEQPAEPAESIENTGDPESPERLRVPEGSQDAESSQGSESPRGSRKPGEREDAPLVVPYRAVPASPPGTLTPREREIVALTARGLSNRGIAEELVISPATVARHISNVLTKLGFTSRTQIAAWALSHELPAPQE